MNVHINNLSIIKADNDSHLVIALYRTITTTDEGNPVLSRPKEKSFHTQKDHKSFIQELHDAFGPEATLAYNPDVLQSLVDYTSTGKTTGASIPSIPTGRVRFYRLRCTRNAIEASIFIWGDGDGSNYTLTFPSPEHRTLESILVLIASESNYGGELVFDTKNELTKDVIDTISNNRLFDIERPGGTMFFD